MKPTTKSWILLLLALIFASPGSPMTWAAGRTLPVQQRQSTGKPMKTVAEDWDERLQVRTKVQVSADTVLIAEPLEVVVQIQHPADTDVEFAKPQDNWGDLQIENVADQMNQLTGDGHRTSTRRLQAEAWQSGKLQVPQLSFDLVTRTTSDGSEGTGDASLKTDSRQVWRTPEWSIQVVSSRTPEEA